MGNMLQPVMMGVPVMGSLSDTSASVASGTQTPVAICLRAVWCLAIIYLPNMFYYLPKAILAVIVILAVFKMIDYKTPRMLWNCDKVEWLIWAVSCFATLFLGIQIGMLLSVGVSMINIIRRAADGRSNTLGRLEG